MSDLVRPSGPLPSDLELMQLTDGELEPEREAEVRAFAERDRRAQAILASLALAGDLLREDMSREVDDGAADGIASAVMGKLDQGRTDGSEGTLLVLKSRRRAKWIVGSGAVVGALAAAASWVMWVNRWDMDLMPRAEAEMVAPNDPALATPDATHPEVGAIDWGGHHGSLFYVPMTGGKAVVLWIDEAAPKVPR